MSWTILMLLRNSGAARDTSQMTYDISSMDSIRDLLNHRGIQVAIGVSTAAAGLALASHILEKRRYSKARQLWSSQPEDVVVLHQVDLCY